MVRTLIGTSVLTALVGAFLLPFLLTIALLAVVPALEPRLCKAGESLVIDDAPYPESGRSLYCSIEDDKRIIRRQQFIDAAAIPYIAFLAVFVWLPISLWRLRSASAAAGNGHRDPLEGVEAACTDLTRKP